jgi:plastocyanin
MTVAALLVVCVLTLGACQREQRRREPTPLDLATVGSIAGEVRFEGAVPAETVLQLASNAQCAARHQAPVRAGDVLVRDGKVENAIVYIKDGLGDRVFAVPETPVVVDQKDCLFIPRVTATQVGQPIRFINSDPLAHNVHGVSARGQGWNVSLGTKGAARAITLDQSESPIEILCDIHPWMKAYVGVFDHPYFAVTGADGRFTLAKVPPGTYVVEAWHERLGTRSAPVTLGEKGAEQVVIRLGAGS